MKDAHTHRQTHPSLWKFAEKMDKTDGGRGKKKELSADAKP